MNSWLIPFCLQTILICRILPENTMIRHRKKISLSTMALLLSILIYGCSSTPVPVKHSATVPPTVTQANTIETPFTITPTKTVETPSTVTSTPSLIPTLTKTITPTITHSPTAAATIPAPAVRNPNQKLPNNWFIEEHQITESIQSESYGLLHLYENIMRRHENALGASILDSRFTQAMINNQPVTIETDNICKETNPKDCQFQTVVRKNGVIVYQVEHGRLGIFDPVALVPHSWVYDNKWMIEIRTPGGGEGCSIENIIFDGVSLNERFKYTRSFSLFMIEGKPFYFYERNGAFGFAYDFVEYPLDYSSIWYACCCGAAWDNPMVFESGVFFHAKYNGKSHYVIMGKITPP
jgi:hypothetical protein